MVSMLQLASVRQALSIVLEAGFEAGAEGASCTNPTTIEALATASVIIFDLLDPRLSPVVEAFPEPPVDPASLIDSDCCQ